MITGCWGDWVCLAVSIFVCYRGIELSDKKVNGDAFNDTFDKPSQTMIGTIVSIYNSRIYRPL